MVLGLTRVSLINPDGACYLAYARSAYVDRDLHFANEYARHDVRGITGRVLGTGYSANLFACGPAVLWLPFLALADVIQMATGPGEAGALDGFGGASLLAAALANAAYGLAAVLLIADIVRRLVGTVPRGVLPATVCGTPFLFYWFFQGIMSHVPSAFAVALLIWAWLRLRERPEHLGRALFLGLAGGLAMLVRWQDGIFLLFPLADLVRRPGSARLKALLIAAAWGALFLPQAFFWKTAYGSWLTIPHSPDSFSWARPDLAGVLFSPFHGLLWWTPLVLLAVPGLLLRCRSNIVIACLTAGLLLQVYVNSVHHWWGGLAFGIRRLTDCTAIVAVGLACGVVEVRRRWPGGLARVVLWITVSGAAAWSLSLAILLCSDKLAGQDYTAPAELFRAQQGMLDPDRSPLGDFLTQASPAHHLLVALSGRSDQEPGAPGLLVTTTHPDGATRPLSPWFVALLVLTAVALPVVLGCQVLSRGDRALIVPATVWVLSAGYLALAARPVSDPWSKQPRDLALTWREITELEASSQRTLDQTKLLAYRRHQVKDYSRALELNRIIHTAEPSESNAVNLAVTLLNIGLFQEASDVLRGQDPQSPRVARNLALSLYGDGIDPAAVGESLEWFAADSVIREDPATAYRYLVKGNLRLGHSAAASTWLARWRRDFPASPEAEQLEEYLHYLHPEVR